MKSVILAMGTVLVLGCVEQPSSRVAESPQDTVFDELAAVVDQALAAKSVEENRLAQFGVEKQRLVSRLMPNGDWADGQRNTGGREVPTARQTGRAKRRGKPQRGKKGTRQGTKSRELPQEWGVARENGELDNVRIVAISPGWV